MGMSQTCGTAVVPTMARIVLGLAFITMGFHKLMHEATFTPEQASVLHEQLEVTLEPAAPALEGDDATGDVSWRGSDEVQVTLASWSPPVAQDEHGEGGDASGQQESGQEESGDQSDQTSGDDTTGTDDQAAQGDDQGEGDGADDQADDQDEGADDDGQTIDVRPKLKVADAYAGKPVHNLMLMLHDKGLSRPVLMARLVAWIELVAGGLIFIGLLSRISGLLLAVVMAGAFYTTTMGPYFAPGILHGPFEATRVDADYHLYNHVFTQLGLFVLAAGVLLTGAGPISVDRIVFGRKRSQGDNDDMPSVQI